MYTFRCSRGRILLHTDIFAEGQSHRLIGKLHAGKHAVRVKCDRVAAGGTVPGILPRPVLLYRTRERLLRGKGIQHLGHGDQHRFRGHRRFRHGELQTLIARTDGIAVKMQQHACQRRRCGELRVPYAVALPCQQQIRGTFRIFHMRGDGIGGIELRGECLRLFPQRTAAEQHGNRQKKGIPHKQRIHHSNLLRYYCF